ncbi:hypothetical protein D3C81_315250 [compost metagenome]
MTPDMIPKSLGEFALLLVASVAGWFSGRAGRKRDAQAVTTESRLYETVRLELERLTVKVEKLEQRSGRMLNHIYRLEGLMRASGLTPPLFDPDAESVEARK